MTAGMAALQAAVTSLSPPHANTSVQFAVHRDQSLPVSHKRSLFSGSLSLGSYGTVTYEHALRMLCALDPSRGTWRDYRTVSRLRGKLRCIGLPGLQASCLRCSCTSSRQCA